MKLLDAISGLPHEQKLEVAAHWQIAIDPKKRISVDEQIARGLVLVPRWLDRQRLADSDQEALRLLAAGGRGLPISALAAGLSPLLTTGILFRDPDRPERCVMPSAFRLQLPPTPSDSPRAARLLLGSVPDDPRRELCLSHLRRLPPWPWPLLLETVLEHIEDPAWLRRELFALPEAERNLLLAVDALGGDVSAAEVLELEREPSRIASGGGVVVPRRSAIYSLARRGLVLSQHHGWVVPDEVERVIGSQRRARAAIDRQRLLMNRHVYDLHPTRARLAEAPGPIAVALLAGLTEARQLPAEGKGFSRSAVRRVAQRLHIEPARAELLVCLARAAGLARGDATIGQASERLVRAWRQGGAWDESADEPDAFRPGRGDTAKATALVREALLEALLLTPGLDFALRQDVRAAALSDRRAAIAQRTFARLEKAALDQTHTTERVCDAILHHSLAGLGLIDEGEVEHGPVLRASAAGRAWLDPPPTTTAGEARAAAPCRWLSGTRLLCTPDADASAAIEAGRYGSVWLHDEGVGLTFDLSTLILAAEADPDLAGLETTLGLLGVLPEPELRTLIEQARAGRPVCSLTRVSAFLRVENVELRDALYRDPAARGLWAGPPLDAGLLVAAHADRAAVHALLRKHGVRTHFDAERADERPERAGGAGQIAPSPNRG